MLFDQQSEYTKYSCFYVQEKHSKNDGIFEVSLNLEPKIFYEKINHSKFILIKLGLIKHFVEVLNNENDSFKYLC